MQVFCIKVSLLSPGIVIINTFIFNVLVQGIGRSPGGEHGNPLQYSCLGNPMDRGAWQATRVTKSGTWLSDFTFTSFQNRGDQRYLWRIWTRKSQQGLEASIYSVSHSFWTVQQTLVYQTFAFLSPCELPSSQVPKHCPQQPFLSLAEDGISGEDFDQFGESLNSPGSLPCTRYQTFVWFSPVNLSHVNLILRPARRT